MHSGQRTRAIGVAWGLASLVTCSHRALAEETTHEGKDLSTEAQNPISSMISVPVQLNVNGGIGEGDRAQAVLNVQPVIPIGIMPRFALVTRWILPIVGQPHTDEASGSTWGLGDFNPQIYTAFELPLGFSLGPGISVVAPTATDPLLGTGKLQLGPALVLFWTHAPVLLGFLATDTVSVAGAEDREDVHSMLLQPFASVNLPLQTYITTAPQMLFDWENERWTVPLGGGVGKILQLGPQAVNVSVQAYGNVVHPDGGPTWSLRAQFQLLFPVSPKKP